MKTSLRQPTLRQLRGFQAVAAHRSFSRAAQALSLSQPALSAAIRDLEQLLGVSLFERTTHRVALTTAGAALQPQVEWLLNSYAHGVQDMHRALAGQAQQLRLAALPSTMHLLAPALARWQRDHPEVEVAVRDLLNDDLLAALGTGEIDIGLGAELDLPAGIVAVTVGSDEMVAVLPGMHRLAANEELRWRDLKGERLALFARGSTYELALSTLRQHGVAMDAPVRLLYSESLYSLVLNGLAVGVISRLYTRGVALGGLRVVPLRGPAIVRRIALMVRERPGPRCAAAGDCFAHLAAALQRGFEPG